MGHAFPEVWLLVGYATILQLMEDNPPERSRRLVRVAPLLIPILLTSLAMAQLANTGPAPLGVGQIGLFVLLLALSGVLSSSETALTALSSWKLRQLREEDPVRNSVFELLEHNPTRFLTTLLIGNNIVNIAFTALVTQMSLQLARGRGGSESAAVGAATAIATVAVLIFGEITPKSIAVHHSVGVAKVFIRPVYWLSIVLYPLGLGFTWITSQVLRLFKLEPSGATLMSNHELRMMLLSAEESGALEAQEQEMIRGVIELEDTVVREVMTPRVDVVAIKGDSGLTHLQQLVTEHGYSRLPVYAESVDDVKGVVYARDLLSFLGRPEELATTRVVDIMTAVQYVPETLSILSLLRDMRMRKSHIAVVVDEFGGTAGVITLEDIIEEITGEIYDETDEDEVEDIVDLGYGNYRLQGSTHIESIASALKIDFDDDGDFDTVAGFLISELGYIPTEGEGVTHRGMLFTVEEADERRVITVLASAAVADDESAESELEHE